jgi:hypothetical protein
MTYITLALPFSVGGDVAERLLSTAWLFKIATHRLFSTTKQALFLPSTDIGWKSTFRRLVYEVIPNRRYADGVVVLVRDLYESCRQLDLDFKSAELSDWLMFQQSELEYPAKTITLRRDHTFSITTINYDKSSERVIVEPTIPKSYGPLLDKILEEKQKYSTRVVIKDYGTRSCVLRVRGEVQVTIPTPFYYRHMTRYDENKGYLYGGVDVNVDRLNLAIVGEDGSLRDLQTFWFREVVARGTTRKRSRSIIGERVHEMLEYAYHHGIKVLFLEKPDVLGKLKLLWIKSKDRRHENYNYKVSVFRSSVIEMAALKAPLYSIEVKYVGPKGTTNSREHDEAVKRYGLDRHTASAYLIALKGLRHQ